MHDMYIWLDTTAQAVTLGGIPFAAFYACAKPYIRNMLLLKSDYVGAHCCKNFELLCGQDEIKAFLASEDLRFGDFCFVDFADGANPDALTPEQVADIAALQREILSVVWQYVKPGGIMMYSTCTLTKAENQDNRDWFLENSPFTLLEEKELLPSAETDGFYMIKCRRNKA